MTAPAREAPGRGAPSVPPAAWLIARLNRGVLHAVLIGIALIWLLPSLGLLITSLRPRADIASSGWWTVLWQPHLSIANYVQVLTGEGMLRSFCNSLLITVPSTILPVLIAALAGYSFAWIKFRGRDWVFLAVVALMMVPVQMALVPVLKIFNTFQLSRGLIGIWLAHTAFGLPFAIFLLRNFFITLPPALIEAAQIDGASHLRIFTRMVLPMSVPVLASLTIFQFLWVWNDLLMALVFIQNPAYRPLTVHINQLLTTYGTEWHLLSAGAFIVMSVPLIVFFSLQRFFVQGLLSGSVK